MRHDPALRHDGQLDKSPPKSQYLLCTHYEHFVSDSSKEEVLSQWFELKKLILSSPGLVSRKCTRVMISGDTCLSNRVSRVTSTLTVVRLAAFLLLLAIDTSECERVFSLMNNIKSAHRAHVNQEWPVPRVSWVQTVTFIGLTPPCPPHGL